MKQRSRVLKTARRSFQKPEPGAVFSVDEISLVADVPPVVVAQAVANRELKTFSLDGVLLVDAEDVCAWVAALDARIVAAKAA